MKNTKRSLPYGTWSSPFSIRNLAGAVGLKDVQWAGDDILVWLESREGRGVLVAQVGNQAPHELNDLSVRAGLGYGGGEFTTTADAVFFVANNRIYRQQILGGRPRALTPAFGSLASPAVSPDGQWLVYAHSGDDGQDGLALVDTNGENWARKLAYGTDFVMQPVWHPSGDRIAYVTWDFPNMPWNASQLRLATLEADTNGVPFVAHIDVVAGDANSSILQPTFSPDGRYLSYISDVSGFGHIYLYDLASGKHTQLTDGAADYGTPAWVQGIRQYAWTPDSEAMYALRNERGFVSLWRIDIDTHDAERINNLSRYSMFSQISVAASGERVAFIASSSQLTDRIVSYEPNRFGDAPIELSDETFTSEIEPLTIRAHGETVHRRTSTERFGSLSIAQALEWTSHDGETAHGLYYPPTSDSFESIGAPPLIVHVHGGPTSQAKVGFFPLAQFLTTRGYAVLTVNHRGSTGYGRDYMNKLFGAWGEYDVEDAASGAQYLADQGLADPRRLVIYGGSAGGYTVLQSLVSKPGFYAAGVCLYGISNQFTLALESADWKFESRYTETLLGTLPEATDLHRERSPLFHADKINDPVIIFQGEDDVVVPPSQSESIVAALRGRGVPHEYHLYPNEGHGFRRAETLEHFYTSVLNFLKQWVLFN